MTPEAHKIIDYVVFITASRYGITPDEIRLRTRRRSIAFPRQIAGALIREVLGRDISLSEIGRELGGIDYSTVCHGIKLVNDIRDTDSKFADWYDGALTVVQIAYSSIKLTVNKN
jgi:chromosomal replication initiator protein